MATKEVLQMREPHDSPKNERKAGLAHLAYAAIYVIFAIWHYRGAQDHFRRIS